MGSVDEARAAESVLTTVDQGSSDEDSGGDGDRLVVVV